MYTNKLGRIHALRMWSLPGHEHGASHIYLDLFHSHSIHIFEYVYLSNFWGFTFSININFSFSILILVYAYIIKHKIILYCSLLLWISHSKWSKLRKQISPLFVSKTRLMTTKATNKELVLTEVLWSQKVYRTGLQKWARKKNTIHSELGHQPSIS